jgi:hypothetical protein
MTSKERAKELISKFMPHVRWKLSQDDCLDRAKECALLACDLAKEFITGDLSESFDKFIYLEEIKTEINKL